jgi:hypothetical protein
VKLTTRGYIVVLDDPDNGFTCPASWDGDVLVFCGTDNLAVFDTREDAKKLMRITRLHNELLQARGDVPNTDWVTPSSIKKMRIVPVKAKGGA